MLANRTPTRSAMSANVFIILEDLTISQGRLQTAGTRDEPVEALRAQEWSEAHGQLSSLPCQCRYFLVEIA